MKKCLFLIPFLILGCATQNYPVTEQQLAQCQFEASRRDGVAWPDEIQLCLKGHGYIQ